MEKPKKAQQEAQKKGQKKGLIEEKIGEDKNRLKGGFLVEWKYE